MERIRRAYGVPAGRGVRVRFLGSKTPRYGTITQTDPDRLYLFIRLDGEKHSRRFHPTWRLEYNPAEPAATEPHMSNTEARIESLIQAKGLTGSRLKPADIDAAIVAETFTVLPSGRVMVCELLLRNGATVRGESAVVNIENFDDEIGRRISRENARRRVWELEGYLLHQRLHEQRMVAEAADAVSPDVPDDKPSNLEPWQRRVWNERAELRERIAALTKFIWSDAFETLSSTDAMLLRHQLGYMREYHNVLTSRILRWTEKAGQ